MYGKENAVGPLFSWNLTSSIIVYCRSNVKPHAGWTIFLCHLSENEYSEQVLRKCYKWRNFRLFRR